MSRDLRVASLTWGISRILYLETDSVIVFWFSNHPFVFAHGNRKCSVTDLWSLPK